jgi:hypothetical protein
LNCPTGQAFVSKAIVFGSRLLSDKIFRVSGDWSLASDPLQWILMRKTHPVSFVRSTKEILARCMRDKGTPPEDAQRLLDGLPATFDEWRVKAADSAST